MSDAIRAGLWKKESDRGPYYSGTIEVGGVTYWVNLYRNDRKEAENHPDLNLQLKPKEGRPRAAAKSAPRAAPAQTGADDDGDLIPF